jgi:hypothetical protein
MFWYYCKSSESSNHYRAEVEQSYLHVCTWVLNLVYATFVCISDLCMITTLEPRTNMYVSPYVVVLLEMSLCVCHTIHIFIFILTPMFEFLVSSSTHDWYSLQ